MRSSRHSTLATAAAALATQMAFAQGAGAAVTPVIVNSNLAGVDGLTTGGTTYDVSFVGHAYNSGEPNFAFEFPTPADATVASDALEVELLALAKVPTPSPFQVSGCGFKTSGEQQCVVSTPFKHVGIANSYFIDFVLSSVNGVVSTDRPWLGFGAYDYAVWTPETVSSVPEPATLTLMGIGLAGVAGARARRRKKTAD